MLGLFYRKLEGGPIMSQNETVKYAWIDEKQKIVSFAVLRGASQYTARETDFWSQILTWIRAGYRLQ